MSSPAPPSWTWAPVWKLAGFSVLGDLALLSETCGLRLEGSESGFAVTREIFY